MAYVGGEEPSPDGCFLCRAAEAPTGGDHLVERATLTITLLNRYPYNSGHVMVVPLRHVPDLAGLTADEGAALITGTQRAMRAIDSALAPGGYNVGFNQGTAAGASTEHVHLHVVPRWAGDTNFMPVLGDVKVLPEHLDETADKLRQAYSTL